MKFTRSYKEMYIDVSGVSGNQMEPLIREAVELDASAQGQVIGGDLRITFSSIAAMESFMLQHSQRVSDLIAYAKEILVEYALESAVIDDKNDNQQNVIALAKQILEKYAPEYLKDE